jgi:membrane associated rhomboid family serine protease
MIPFKDDNPTQRFPFVTIALIVMNALIFFIEILHPAGQKYIVYTYGAIPSDMLSFKASAIPSTFSSMFLHGGLFHIGGNMLYLWIFGNNIEDRLGHFKFILFYLLCGVVAAYSHAITAPGSYIPMIGASGAVSGVLGAYLLLYPHAKVHTLIFFGFFVQVVRLPAIFVIGFWAVIQIINGIISKGLVNQGGVAWFAHIGGFLFGLLMIKLWLPKRRKRWS